MMRMLSSRTWTLKDCMRSVESIKHNALLYYLSQNLPLSTDLWLVNGATADAHKAAAADRRLNLG
jgi:hypothetical protein